MRKKIIITLIIVLIAAGLIFGPSLLARFNASFGTAGTVGAGGPGGPGGMPGRPGGAGGSGSVFSVRTADAEIRNLQAYIEINGNIVNQGQVTVVPEASGRLVSMRAALGATVNRGQLVAEVDPSRPGSEYSLSPVYAPVTGVVVSNPVSVGSTVTTGTALFTIAYGTLLEIEAMVPEREIGQLREGLPAELRLEAFPGEIFLAQISTISPVVDPVSRTKSIVLRFVSQDQRISPGMFARIKLNTRTYNNVISIPQDAIVESRGIHTVFVLSGEDRVSMREVSLGVTVDGEAEIRSGLDAGDKVVVQGQQFLTDGAAVRVLGR